MKQDLDHDSGVGENGDDSTPPSAVCAPKDIDGENPSQQFGPIEASSQNGGGNSHRRRGRSVVRL